LKELACKAKDSLEALGLRPNGQSGHLTADLLNDACKCFQSQPESFAVWEKEQIARLRKGFGLTQIQLPRPSNGGTERSDFLLIRRNRMRPDLP